MGKIPLAKWTVRFLIAGLLALGWWNYSAGFNQHAFSGLLSARQESLRALGQKLLEYAQAHEGRLPESFSAMQDEGLITPADVRPLDPCGRFDIKCQLRPLPRADLAGDLILVLETYEESYYGKFNVLYLSGDVLAECKLGEVLRKDNDLRRSLGLAELPP